MDAKEQRRAARLAPDVNSALHLLLNLASQNNLKLWVGRTAGNLTQTARNVKAGRSSANQKASWHDLKQPRAIDIYIRDPRTGKIDTKARNEKLYRKLALLAESLGFRQIAWQGVDLREKKHLKTKKGSAWDPFHFEFRGPYMNLKHAIRKVGLNRNDVA